MAGSKEQEESAAEEKIEKVQMDGFAHEKISKVLQLRDPSGLDGDEFDPIAYINEKFPDENSLGPLEGGDLTNFLANCGGNDFHVFFLPCFCKFCFFCGRTL